MILCEMTYLCAYGPQLSGNQYEKQTLHLVPDIVPTQNTKHDWDSIL